MKCTAALEAQERAPLRVGFSERDITPPLGLPLDGYEGREGPATGLLDPLRARIFVATCEEQSAAIIALDVVGIGMTFFGLLRSHLEQSFGKLALIVAATHTHSAPVGFRDNGQSGAAIEEYIQSVVLSVVDGAQEARRRSVAVSTSIGRAATEGICANRNDPARLVDTDVRALVFTTVTTSELVGVIATFACHSTILPAANLSYSGDLHGNAAQLASMRLTAPCILLNGAEGDVSSRYTRRSQNAKELERLSMRLQRAIMQAVKQAKTMGVGGGRIRGANQRALAVAELSIDLPLQAPPSPRDAARLLKDAVAELEAQRRAGATPSVLRRSETRVQGAEAVLQRAKSKAGRPATAQATLTAIRIDDCVLVSVPGELFASGPLEVGPPVTTTLVVGLANGYLGYFPSIYAYEGHTYEALRTPFPPAARERLLDALRRVSDLAAADREEDCPAGLETEEET